MTAFHNEQGKSAEKFSDKIKNKLLACGGSETLPLLKGDRCHIVLNEAQDGFFCDKLNNYKISYRFEVFDVIEDLLNRKNGKAVKGNGRGKQDKVGYGKCGLDTVAGYVAYNYAGKDYGDSTFDPVFVLAAILDWANLARNLRGYIVRI